ALNDPLRIGDQGILAVTVAERLKLGRVSYSLPVGYSGLRANVGYTGLRYEIGEELSSLDAAGTAETASAGLQYAFLRSRGFNIWGDIDYDYKALRDEALGAVAHDKRIGDWTLAVRGDSLDGLWGGGLSNFLLGVTYGDLNLSRVAADADVDALTA